MCGIFGFTNLNAKNRRLAYFLAYSMESRGADSWGASDGNEIIKYSGPISASFHLPYHWKQAIVHTRSASMAFNTTRAVAENAHPFSFVGKAKKVIGVHNGYVGNWQYLNTKYQPFPVDSMHIFHHMAEGLPLDELEGRGTIAWFEPRESKMEIHLARWNFGDLEVYLENEGGGIVFCSTEEPILRGTRMCRVKIIKGYQKLADGFTHIFDGQELIKLEKFGFKEISQITVNSKTSNGNVKNLNEDFLLCRKCGAIHTQHVICLSCMKELRMKFEQQYKSKKQSRGNANWAGFVKV